MTKARFDAAYYRRYYVNRTSRVADAAYFDGVGRFIAAYANLLALDVRSILDLGCGIGAFRKPLERRFRRARYVGVEASDYACGKYGWEHGSVVDYDGGPFDLVVCHDVLQYLSPAAANAAIANLDQLCASVLFFGVLTREDWEENCDQSRTDGDVRLRRAAWYRTRLRRYFLNLGGGFYLSRKSDAVVYALEHVD